MSTAATAKTAARCATRHELSLRKQSWKSSSTHRLAACLADSWRYQGEDSERGSHTHASLSLYDRETASLGLLEREGVSFANSTVAEQDVLFCCQLPTEEALLIYGQLAFN